MPARASTLRRAAALGAAAVAAGALLAAAPVRAASGPAYDDLGTAHLLALVNAHRAAIGEPALRVDPRLADIARAWTLSMATTRTLAHNDGLFSRDQHAALGIATFGENVAYSSLSVNDAHDALMRSPHHLANIETAGFAVAGFAVARDTRGWYWVTEDFGTAPRVTGTVASAPTRTTTPATARAGTATDPVLRTARTTVAAKAAATAAATAAARTRAAAAKAAATAAARQGAAALARIAAANARAARGTDPRATRVDADLVAARAGARSAARPVAGKGRDGGAVPYRGALALLAGCLSVLALAGFGARVRLDA